MREEKQREHIRNGDWEYVDNEIHFQPENEEELKEVLIGSSLCCDLILFSHERPRGGP